MLKNTKAFSSFSVDDLAAAKKFYGEVLGLAVKETSPGLHLELKGGGEIFIYPKDNHEPATFTVLNFEVDNIDEAVDELVSKGVIFEHYDGMHQDKKGIARAESPSDGPSIAWFTDPAGNILAVLH